MKIADDAIFLVVVFTNSKFSLDKISLYIMDISSANFDFGNCASSKSKMTWIN